MGLAKTLNIWFKAARAPFLVVSLLPAIVGGVIAYSHGFFDWAIFVIATLGAVSAHSAADFVDDYFDFINGNLGNKEQQFHDSPLIRGEITLKQVMTATIICLAIAVAAGVYLIIEVGTPVLYLMLAGGFIVLFYTSPPIRLNYRGLGETALFFAFGPLIVFGIYYVLTGSFSLEPIIVGVPLGIFTMNVGIVSNIFDYEDDVKSGKKCMPVRFGQPATYKILLGATIVGFATVVVGAFAGLLPLWNLAVLLTAPLAFGMLKETSNFTDTGRYTPAMTKAIALSSLSSIAFGVAYGLSLTFPAPTI